MLADEAVRLPGARRAQAYSVARTQGVLLSESLLSQITQLAA